MELQEEEIINPVSVVADKLDADIYFISGLLDREMAHELIDTYATAEQRTNCALILSTYGGDADAAYIIARFLKRAYKHFTLLCLVTVRVLVPWLRWELTKSLCQYMVNWDL